jgi:hypothetical protein
MSIDYDAVNLCGLICSTIDVIGRNSRIHVHIIKMDCVGWLERILVVGLIVTGPPIEVGSTVIPVVTLILVPVVMTLSLKIVHLILHLVSLSAQLLFLLLAPTFGIAIPLIRLSFFTISLLKQALSLLFLFLLRLLFGLLLLVLLLLFELAETLVVI